jgi:hypothetical protein
MLWRGQLSTNRKVTTIMDRRPRMSVRVGLEASTRGKATLSYCDRDAATVAVAGRIDVARRATTSALSGYWGSYVGPS